MSGGPLILGGDIGGTKTNLGLFEAADGEPRLVRLAAFTARSTPGCARSSRPSWRGSAGTR